MKNLRKIVVLNLGLGVQSTKLYLDACDGLLDPKPTVAIFADTKDEVAATYKHLEWMKAVGTIPILTPSEGKLSDHLIAGKYCRNGNRFASIPAFTLHTDGTHGRTRRQCTKEYKTQVIGKCIRREVIGLRPRQPMPRDIHLIQYFGISWDERQRRSRIMERVCRPSFEHWIMGKPIENIPIVRWGSRSIPYPGPFVEPRFSLIERQITRDDCRDDLRRKVPHRVPRSACKECPFRSDAEWLDMLLNDPEDFEDACRIDAALRQPGTVANLQMDDPMFIHRSCQPLVQIDFAKLVADKSKQQSLGFSEECEGMCGV